MSGTQWKEDPGLSTRILLPFALDVSRTVGIFRYGSGDPAYFVDTAGIWRAIGTPAGPTTTVVSVRSGELELRAWGPGAAWAVEHARALAGLEDSLDGFAPAHPLLRQLQSRFRGVRFARTNLVMESLVPAILSQKITGKEAFTAWRRMLYAHGLPAPGPAPQRLRVPPDADVLRTLDDAAWHSFGVDRAHRETLRRCFARAQAIERLTSLPAADAAQRLQSIRGIGVWTAAEVAERAWGSADHPSFGDYHIASSVGVALVGAPVDDGAMAELLEPFRPHRGRVVRLIELAGISKPRRGPRRTVTDYRAI